jgi:hypothetical protein
MATLTAIFLHRKVFQNQERCYCSAQDSWAWQCGIIGQLGVLSLAKGCFGNSPNPIPCCLAASLTTAPWKRVKSQVVRPRYCRRSLRGRQRIGGVAVAHRDEGTRVRSDRWCHSANPINPTPINRKGSGSGTDALTLVSKFKRPVCP